MQDPVRFPDWRELLDALLSYLPAVWRQTTGKASQRLLVAFALAMEALYGSLQRVMRMAFAATSEGVWLRELARSWGMDVYEGIAATVTVQFRAFDPPLNPITIPAGTRLRSREGLIFRTTLAVTLPAGAETTTAPAQADRPGTIGNIEAGDIVALLTGIPGIDEVTNPAPATGGIDAEPDGAIRARIPIHLATLHRATVPATEGIINSDRVNFPEVSRFVSERSFLTPGYFRAFVADQTASESYRAKGWTAHPTLSGIWQMAIPPGLTISGLVEPGWPCQRYGEVQRAPDGQEVWAQSTSVPNLQAGNFLWRIEGNILYARAIGDDLNAREITLIAGLIQRVYDTLRREWVAAGVHFDVLVPLRHPLNIEISYELLAGFTATTVENQLRQQARNYALSLPMGGTYAPDALLEWLLRTNGVQGARVDSPVVTVTPAPTSVIRIDQITINRLN